MKVGWIHKASLVGWQLTRTGLRLSILSAAECRTNRLTTRSKTPERASSLKPILTLTLQKATSSTPMLEVLPLLLRVCPFLLLPDRI